MAISIFAYDFMCNKRNELISIQFQIWRRGEGGGGGGGGGGEGLREAIRPS